MELQNKVRSYLTFCHRMEQEETEKDSLYLINKLPLKLKQDLSSAINGKVIRQIPVLIENFSMATVQELGSSLETIRVSPQEMIICEDSPDDCSLYLIQ